MQKLVTVPFLALFFSSMVSACITDGKETIYSSKTEYRESNNAFYNEYYPFPSEASSPGSSLLSSGSATPTSRAGSEQETIDKLRKQLTEVENKLRLLENQNKKTTFITFLKSLFKM